MKSVSSAQRFCKTVRCPSSEELLRYRRRTLMITERFVIEKHLRDCEFCSAELELLKRHRFYIERASTAEMPSNLRRLAEHLFSRRRDLSRAGNLYLRRQLTH